MARKPSCLCGACPKCQHRIYMRGYLRRPEAAEKNRAKANRYRAENLELCRAKNRARPPRLPKHSVVATERGRRYAARQEGVYVERVDYLAVAERDGYLCQLCDTDLSEFFAPERIGNGAFAFDHILSTFLGGPHTFENIWLLCHDCHAKKTWGERRVLASLYEVRRAA
jgi:5-methylcytosine-specific restriction endonuclease McrA